MLQLDKFIVEDWAQWRRGELDLSHAGVTFIRGCNVDRAGSANGAGKSSFTNALYALLTGDHQLSVRKKSLGQLLRKNTRMSLRGSREDHPFVLRLADGKLSCKFDGEMVDSRTKDGARKFVTESIVGMTPELWSSTVHLNGIAGNPLVRGTSAQRCQFIERAFELDRWAQRYDVVRDVVSTHKRTAADLEDAKNELSKLPPSVNLKALRHKRTEVQDKIRSLRTISDKATADLADYRNLPKCPRESSAHYADVASSIESKLAESRASSDALAAWRSARDRYESAVDERGKLRTTLAECNHLLGKYDPRDLPRWRERLARLQVAASEVDEFVEHVSTVSKWKALASSIAHKHGIKFDGLDSLRSLSVGWVNNLRGGETSCPVCGSRLRSRLDREELNRLADLVDVLPKKLFDPSSIDRNLPKKVDSLRKIISAAERIKELTRDLQEIRVPTVPKKPDVSECDPVKLARQMSVAKELLRRAEAWEDVDKRRLERARVIAEQVPDKLRRAEDSLRDIDGQITAEEVASGMRESIKTKIESLEKELRLQPIYRALCGAYSPNGVRLWMLSSMLEAITSSLNSFANTTRDRVMYGYKLSRNRDLTLTATNLSGTFDVRMLSGAEAGVFCLNLLIAVLPLLPTHKRCSLLILDEIDANADRSTKQVIAREYLPSLMEIAPSILFVTPAGKQDIWVSGARELVVEKRNGVSRFV